jgi:hypothetical protein
MLSHCQQESGSLTIGHDTRICSHMPDTHVDAVARQKIQIETVDGRALPRTVDRGPDIPYFQVIIASIREFLNTVHLEQNLG